ncbi:leucine-rich repeat domain-containing protein [Runella sp. SP2]|uniref:leucine-rich repeat domain-containing protein n=1 Tax=Runella sp. SP2 TaxID=2268026 RepID=UPI000F07C30E|nr:leucine-rich repeat domain-containing protein [Runella sp. SP2]AYQ31570.1 hypothetical protein DTQ70_04995 [Runella sp. SP2]
MKSIFLYGYFLLLPFVLRAQADCPFYKTYIERGEAELKKGDKADFKTVIEAFSNAMIHCPAKADEARSKIVKAFDAINALKIRAEKDKNTAIRARKEADSAKVVAQRRATETENAKTETETALNEVNSARQKAQDVLDKIYFYKGKFGLAYDGDKKKYGFIDKYLNIKIDFKYEEALPFNQMGLAKVKRFGNYYLIDTNGTEYKLATDILKLQLESGITALDLSDRNVEEIDPLVFQHSQLKVLLLNGNQLKQIPEGIKFLVNLLYLNLSQNKIEQLENLDSLLNLVYFNCELNRIIALGGLDNLKSLQTFDISSNQIQKLEGLDSLKSLQTFNISLNQIQKLEGLDNLKSLQTFNISLNQIQKLEGLDSLKSLQTFNISLNQIQKLEGLDNLKSLQTFNISLNQIQKLEGLDNLKSLQAFGILGNYVCKLEGLDSLKSLQNFNISSNQIQKLEGLEHLKNIKNLSIGRNPLSVADINPRLKTMTNIEELSLNNLGLTILPDVIFSLKNLKKLDLGNLGDKNQNNFSKPEQEKIKKLLPNCEITF